MRHERPSDPFLEIEIFLSDEERALLLGEPSIPGFLKDRVRFAVVERDQRSIRLSPVDAELLLDHVLMCEKDARTPAAREGFGEIAAELAASILVSGVEEAISSGPPLFVEEGLPASDRQGDGEPPDDGDFPEDEKEPGPEGGPFMPPELAEEIQTILDKDTPGDLEEVQAEIGRAIDAYNRRPMPDAGGLSPEQLFGLIQADWSSPDSPLHLEDSLPLEAVADSRVFQNARILLSALRDSGGTKTTAKGNLNRKFVAEIIERLRFRDVDSNPTRWIYKVLNESDVPELELLRLAVGFAGLIRKYRGEFLVTRAGKKMLEDANAGELYVKLFRAYFQRVNLGFNDRMSDLPGLQATSAYIFLRLRDAAKDWRSAEDLVGQVLLPPVREEMEAELHPDVFTWPLELRVLRTLEGFGLLEERLVPPDAWLLATHEFRKTELFDRFLRFTLDV